MPPNDKLSTWPDAAGENARSSVIASDLVIEGDVASEGPVDIQGKIIGSMRAPEVVIASSGRIEGTVNAHGLSVLGFVSGAVSARHVQLSASAVVHADIIHERIAIDAGAEIDGRLQRKA